MSTNSMNSDQTVSLGDWVGTLILTGIPVVSFIMLLVWAFGDNTKLSKKNFARATLIIAIVGAVVGTLLWIIFAVIFASAFATMGDAFATMSYS